MSEGGRKGKKGQKSDTYYFNGFLLICIRRDKGASLPLRREVLVVRVVTPFRVEGRRRILRAGET